jgi:hypothetical protein
MIKFEAPSKFAADLPEEQLIKTENDFRNNSTAWTWRGHNVLHPEICHVANERPGSSRICKCIAPEHPLESRDRRYHQALEEQGKCRLATSKTSIKKTNSRDDKPDYEATEDEVGVMVFESNIRRIHVDL